MSRLVVPMHGRDHCPGGSDPIPAGCLPGGVNAIRFWTGNMNLSVSSSGDARLSFDSVSSFDSTIFTTITSGGRYTSVHYELAGWYATFVTFVWESAPAAGTHSGIMFQWTGDNLGSSQFAYPNDGLGQFHIGRNPSASVTRYFPAENSSGVDSLPGAPEVWVAQTGAARTINYAWWHSVYLGAGDY